MEAHICISHLDGYLPYQCVYCLTSGAKTRVANKTQIKAHLKERHANEKFQFIDAQEDDLNAQLQDILQRSLYTTVLRNDTEVPKECAPYIS